MHGEREKKERERERSQLHNAILTKRQIYFHENIEWGRGKTVFLYKDNCNLKTSIMILSDNMDIK